jgi:hypothetical protein
LIGEDIERRSGHLALRSMSDPNSEGQPDTYLGSMWYTGTGDNGGVHYNSGVLNHWFYRLSVGGNGTNDNGTSFSVSGIGIDKAAKIAYRLESVYLSSNSNYQAAANFGAQAASDLFGASSAEYAATVEAFKAVGLTVSGSGGGTGGGTGTETCGSVSGISVSRRKWAYYTYTVPTGASSFKASTTGTNGDVDLYVRFGANPTTTNNAGKSEGSTSNESVTISNPQAGTWYIGLYGYAAATNVTLNACHTGGAIMGIGAKDLSFNGEEQAAEAVSVFPNPVANELNINLGFELSEGAKVKVVSVTGQEMMSIEASELKGGINVSSLPKGIYLVQAFDGKSKVSARFVKQ